MRQYSVYDLGYGYLSLFYNLEEVSEEFKRETIRDFQRLLDLGWTDKELICYLRQAKYNKDDAILNLGQFFHGLAPKVDNLLKRQPMFYHNQLRITTPPPVVIYNPDTGESIRNVKPYYLELRSSFTMEDLKDYFKQTKAYQPETMNDKRLEGSFNWLLKSYTIEDILFMMDEANIAIHSGRVSGLSTPSNLSDFFVEAKRSKERKMNELRQVEGDKIVPQKRRKD